MHETSRVEATLSRDAVREDEQEVLRADLETRGLDTAYWRAMNGLLTTTSRSDTPLVLRLYRRGRLGGLAYVMECRRTSRCLFPGVAGRMLDIMPMPGYCWNRGDAGVDLLGSPGFVADGESRETLYREAIGFLNRRYTMGSVLEESAIPAAGPCYETVMMDWGRYRVLPGGCDTLVHAHGNLRRKVSKFRNKGGTLEIVHGRLDRRAREAVLRCLAHSATAGLLRTPFQENYPNMVRWAAEADVPAIVHVVARIDGEVVGYHTYLRTGGRLQCLSGGFDRTRQTTYHAYENVLLETMRYAESSGLGHVAFGPITNPSKAAVMPQTARFVIRFYSRFRPVRRLLESVIPRSALRPAVLAPYVGLCPAVPPGMHLKRLPLSSRALRKTAVASGARRGS